MLSDLRDRRSHLLDGIKQRDHRAHTHSGTQASTLASTGKPGGGRRRGKSFANEIQIKLFVLNTTLQQHYVRLYIHRAGGDTQRERVRERNRWGEKDREREGGREGDGEE